MSKLFTLTNRFLLVTALVLIFTSFSWASSIRSLDGSSISSKGRVETTFVSSSKVASPATPAATPIPTPGQGTYTGTQLVTITTTSSGASIRFTLDGTDPSSTNGTLYTGPISITANATLKTIAFGAGYTDSPISSDVYTINCETPVLSPASGTYDAGQKITMSTPTVGATIYYTTDGSVPTASSTPYVSRITLNESTVIRAIAIKTGMGNSDITTESYSILQPVVAPAFAPAPGTYSAAQNVAITSQTPGVTIYYTIDGSTPTTSSPVYTGPVPISSNVTLRAIAVKAGMSNSTITAGNYIIQLPVAAPVFSVPAGTYPTTQTVTITCATAGATVYYTLDGTTPTSSSPVYSGPITISSTSTLNAVAQKSGMSNSSLTSAAYVIAPVIATPTFTPAAGTYTSAQLVTIASTTPGVTIYYTLDGTTPTNASLTYSSPVNITANTTLNAFAVKTGMTSSQVATGNYVINYPVAAPTFSVPAGTYNSTVSVTIATTTTGATIYYTTDGSTPTTASPQYTGPVSIATTSTLNAIAIKTGMTNSSVTTALYTIQPLKTANPVFTPAPGNYTTAQSVTITCTTTGATIKYTTDGSTPSKTNGTTYTAPISINANQSFKAIAFVTGYQDSDVTSAAYTINLGATDSDGDGIPDVDDDYPQDPALTLNNYFPATGFGSLAFEDNWPLKADYDMNDMVIDYRINQITNSKNEVAIIKAKFVLRAMGTTTHNGFGIELPLTPAQISSCTVTTASGKANPIGNIVTLNSKGLESSNNQKAVVILFEDGFNLFPTNAVGPVNTSTAGNWMTPDTLNVTITLAQPVSMTSLSDSRVYNPFIFTNKTRSSEIHLPNYTPTSLANTSLFNTGEDNSNPTTGKYYKTANNMPWALNIYEEYSYPIESTSVTEAFLHFVDWAQSSGVLYPDWYKLKDGYRKAGTIYTHP